MSVHSSRKRSVCLSPVCATAGTGARGGGGGASACAAPLVTAVGPPAVAGAFAPAVAASLGMHAKASNPATAYLVDTPQARVFPILESLGNQSTRFIEAPPFSYNPRRRCRRSR